MSRVLALAFASIVSPIMAETGCYSVTQTMEQWTPMYNTSWPINPHYSGMAVVMHTAAWVANNNVAGKVASNGLKSLAETGATSTLLSEATSSSAAMSAGALPPTVKPGSGQTDGTGGTQNTKRYFAETHIEVDSMFPHVSLYTMIAPSPDWYAYGTAMLFENGAFVSKTINLVAYDSGTDSGTTYTAANSVTNPAVNIAKITDSRITGPSAGTSDRIMMTMTFTPMCCYTATQSGMDRWTQMYNTALPVNPHYSGMTAGIHTSAYQMSTVGQAASVGLKALAETGAASTLATEMDANANTPASTSLMNAKVLQPMAGAGQTDGTGGFANTKRMFANARMMVSTAYPHVSMATMIAPSPDWYAYGMVTLYTSSAWQIVNLTLVAYDAGTDSGATYTAANSVTNPAVNIAKIIDSRITGAGVTGDRNMFYMSLMPDNTCNRVTTSTLTSITSTTSTLTSTQAPVNTTTTTALATLAPVTTSGTPYDAVFSWMWFALVAAAWQLQ